MEKKRKCVALKTLSSCVPDEVSFCLTKLNDSMKSGQINADANIPYTALERENVRLFYSLKTEIKIEIGHLKQAFAPRYPSTIEQIKQCSA